MAEIKSFDPAVIASLSTRILLVAPFSRVHEAAEWIMGHPVWTHQFPELADEMRAAVLKQFPEMPTDCDEEPWEQVRDAVYARYGTSIDVARGEVE